MFRDSTIKRYSITLALTVALLGVLSSNATADMFAGSITGTLTYNSGGLTGLVANGDWAQDATTLTYTVTLADSGDYYLYEYVLDVGAVKGISHLIFETSLDATIAEFVTYNQDTEPASQVYGDLYEPNPYATSGSNPGLPDAGIYGIKLEDMKNEDRPDADDADAKKLYLSFRSVHQPMWGDFYAKGGKYSGNNSVFNYLYNARLGGLGDPLVDPDRYNYYSDEDGLSDLSQSYVLVPDTKVVPVPGAVLLGSMGLSVAGYFLRRKRSLS